MKNNLPNIWIHKENVFMFEKRDFENEVEYVPKEKLDIAVNALKGIYNLANPHRSGAEWMILKAATNALNELGHIPRTIKQPDEWSDILRQDAENP